MVTSFFQPYIMVLAAILISFEGAAAGPIFQWRVEDGGNGNYYEAVDDEVLWPDARTMAETRLFMGVSGHLATITSQAEQDFIEANFPLAPYWIGAFQDTTAPDYSEPAGGFRWVTGEPFLYTNWNTGEPNNQGQEDYVQFEGSLFLWNDRFNTTTDPFLVEYETGQAVIPEPSTLAILLTLFGVATAILFLRRSFFQRALGQT